MSHTPTSRAGGDGSDANPFRPLGAEQPGWASIDLRPRGADLAGFCLLALPVRDDRAGTIYLGDGLDDPIPALIQDLHERGLVPAQESQT